MKTIIVTAAALAILAGTAQAQVKYTDDQGNSHWVESRTQVPEKYRDRWTRPDLPQLQPSGNLAERYQYQERIEKAEGAIKSNRIDVPKVQVEPAAPATARPSAKSKAAAQPVTKDKKAPVTMCVSGENRVMTGAGHWKVDGSCGE